MKTKNVSSVYKDKLCCSCGVCKGICPTSAITYSIDKKGFLKPVIEEDGCVNCGQCVKYCPGTQFFSKETNRSSEHIYGHSNTSSVRKESSSGGMGTELLAYLLKKKYIDSCIVVRNITKIGEVKVAITSNISEVYENMGSKYCPVPIGDVLKTVVNGNKRFAVIGLPCQIAAIRKYCKDSKNNVIRYYISLLCNHVPSYSASEFLLHNLHIQSYDKILYRGGGWPGYFKIFTEDTVYELPYRKTVATGFGKYFKNFRCEICDDPFGECADISLGDAYFLTETENKDGNTFCIVRNREVMRIIGEMERENIVTVKRDVNQDKVNKAFKVLTNRINAVPGKVALCKSIHKPVPDHYGGRFNEPLSLKSKLVIMGCFILNDIGKFKFLWKYLFVLGRGKSLQIDKTRIRGEYYGK